VPPNNQIPRRLEPRFEIVILSVLMIAGCLDRGLAAAPADQKSLADLEIEADQVLSEQDNVARRARIAPVFLLAERYASLGQTNKAMSYYTKALEHQPWNLGAQLAMARLLFDSGQTDRARQKADLVWNHAETDDLLIEAAKVLGKPFNGKVPLDDAWPPGPTGLALVPVGNVDALATAGVARGVAEVPGHPGYHQTSPVGDSEARPRSGAFAGGRHAGENCESSKRRGLSRPAPQAQHGHKLLGR